MSDNQAANLLVLQLVLDEASYILLDMNEEEIARKMSQESLSPDRLARIKARAAMILLGVAQKAAEKSNSDYVPGVLGKLIGGGA